MSFLILLTINKYYLIHDLDEKGRLPSNCTPIEQCCPNALGWIVDTKLVTLALCANFM